MVSEHADGEMIAQILLRLGWKLVRGSSTRGARKAAAGLIRRAKGGASVAITPDGPRGPRHKIKQGALKIASKSGAVVLPAAFSAARPIRFRSWDRFMLWWPFGKAIAVYGEPIVVPPALDDSAFQALRVQIEKRMIDLEHQADAYFR